ncbi:MAG: Erythromycin esterase [Cryobacterium sp.]|jgi:predicted phosphoribosyltransferase|nr:Erythromycin esterase [Cryobacterium sp.]
MFTDRTDAGRRLGARVAGLALVDPVVYALPRGGVPVAVEVAAALKAPLDLLIVRKIGTPGNPEVALGAVVDGDEPQMFINEDIFAETGRDVAGLQQARNHELAEIERRRHRYLGDRPPINPHGRVVVVVDDGLATGATAKVALAALRRHGAAQVILAVPVAPADTLGEMKELVDVVIALEVPTPFWAIGPFYRDFHQLSDEETIGLLRQAWDG